MSDYYNSLIKEACQVERDLRDLLFDCRLSPETIVDGCLSRSDSTQDKLKHLEEKLRARPQDFRHCWAFINQCSKMFESGKINQGIPSTLSRMAFAPSYLDAERELANLGRGNSLFELYAIACKRTAEKHPQMFGSVTDPAAREKKIQSLKAEKEELYDRLGKEFDLTDLCLGQINRDGWAYITMAAAPKVGLMSLESLGERLVGHIMATEPEVWDATPKVDLGGARKREERAQIAG